MAISPRLIKRRIKSIRSTRKIMKAMELVAASKMRKATQLALMTRPYSVSLDAFTKKAQASVPGARHPFLTGAVEGAGVQMTFVVVVASDRGLCGGFNSQLLKKTLEFLRTRAKDEARVVTVGRRAEQAVKRAGYEIFAAFESISNAPSFARTLPLGDLIRSEYLAGRVGAVFMVYTDFRGALSQVPLIKQLLPMTESGAVKIHFAQEGEDEERSSRKEVDLAWEPSADEILDALLPRNLEMGIYQNLLESSASEQAARMMAMRSAGDAASEMLDGLISTLNQARQAGITREISEISAGKAAIE